MRDVLRAPGALSLFIASCVARLPMGALGLLLVLHTQQLTGSYAKGGLASGAYAIALALSNPALARIVDRRGQTLVLRTGAPLAAAAILVLATLPDGAPLGAILAAAAVAGACQPPVGACMRALWPVLLDSPDRRHAAYSMEGALLEIVYICGPVLIVAGIGSWSTSAAMAACAVFLLAGDLAFSAHPVSRAWRPHAERPRDLTGALRGPGVRVLVAVFVLCGLSIGAVEVVVPAALDATGHRELTGLLLGVWGAGSMFAGLAIGRAGAAADPPRRLALALGAWGIAHAALGAVGRAGRARACCCSSPARRSRRPSSRPTGCSTTWRPVGTITEAFTWTSTGIAVGIAAGSCRRGRARRGRVAGPGHGGARRRRRARRPGRAGRRHRAAARRGARAGVTPGRAGRGPSQSYTRPPPAALAPWPSHLRRWRNW